MRFEVTIVATNTVLIDADNEDAARQMAIQLYERQDRFLDGADYGVTNVVPDPFNEAGDCGRHYRRRR